MLLRDGETLSLDGEEIEVISTPGHTPGGVCYLCNGEFLVTGDTLFASGCGRTDFPRGSTREMKESLEKLKKLPQNLPIYPGHGPASTLGAGLSGVIL